MSKGMSLITTKGMYLPLCDIANISESEIECESFMQYKLTFDFPTGANYVYIKTVHDEYHQIDVMDIVNQEAVRPTNWGTEYMYETTVKRFLVNEWTKLRESGIVQTLPYLDK